MSTEPKQTPTLHIKDPVARERVRQITVQIVTSQVVNGELDPYDDKALREATRKAAWLAWDAYKAAEEYVRG